MRLSFEFSIGFLARLNFKCVSRLKQASELCRVGKTILKAKGNDVNYSWKVQSEFLTFHRSLHVAADFIVDEFYENSFTLLLFDVSTRSM